jgi:GMP synthase (glutamine-hydrolysing)
MSGASSILVVDTNLVPTADGSAQRIATYVRGLTSAAVRIEHFSKITPQFVAATGTSAIILGGQGTSWEQYPPGSLSRIQETIRSSGLPILGICGGHQLVALAFGGTVDRIKRLRPGAGYDGCYREEGFVSVDIIKDDLVVGKAGTKIVVAEAHYDEIKSVPTEFSILASNSTSPVQAMRHNRLPIWGVQFHPEKSDAAHGDGRAILQRFLEFPLGRAIANGTPPVSPGSNTALYIIGAVTISVACWFWLKRR